GPGRHHRFTAGPDRLHGGRARPGFRPFAGGPAMKVWTIGMTGLRRLFRDRSSIFFVFILPLAIILLIGAQFGSGGAPEILVHHDGGQVATSIVEALEGVRAETSDDADELVEDVERGGASAGVLFP